MKTETNKKLRLNREEIAVLGVSTGVKAGTIPFSAPIPATYLCGYPHTRISCYHQP